MAVSSASLASPEFLEAPDRLGDLADRLPSSLPDSIASSPSRSAERSDDWPLPWIVSASWLQSHLPDRDADRNADRDADQDLVIVDCRFALNNPDLGRQQYETSHIPGAHYLDLNRDLSSPVQQHGGRHPLPDPHQFAQTLSRIGIHAPTADRPAPIVVAYDDSRFAFAARLWWLLRYHGHERVVLLDGGFKGWVAAGYPVTADPTPLPVQTRPFVPQLRLDWVVDRDRLQSRLHAPDLVLIDSREAERYRGEQEPIDPVAGRIPGAINYPWQGVTNPEGYIHPPEQQQQRWADLPEGEVIVYCGSGVTACVNLLSLALSDRPQTEAKLYAGSWSDWCSYGNAVLESGSPG